MQRPYNVSLYPGTGSADGRRGDHIILAPAYNITSDEIRHLVETVTMVVTQFFTAHGADLRDAAAAMPTTKIVESGSEPVLIESSVMHKPARR